jgi:hypothetical protein
LEPIIGLLTGTGSLSGHFVAMSILSVWQRAKLKFVMVMKTKLLLEHQRQSGYYRGWPRKCIHQVRLRQHDDQHELK